MKITLVRHGKPSVTDRCWISSSEFAKWIEMYDDSSIHEKEIPPRETIDIVKEASFVATSELTRAIQSALRLHPVCKIEKCPLFNEIQIPVALISQRYLRLPIRAWMLNYRLLWFAGFAQDVESYKEARKRAKSAAQQLIQWGEQYETIVIVGHGWFHRIVGRELRKNGFQLEKSSGWTFWSFQTYIR